MLMTNTLISTAIHTRAFEINKFSVTNSNINDNCNDNSNISNYKTTATKIKRWH